MRWQMQFLQLDSDPLLLKSGFSRAIKAPQWTRPVYWPQKCENAHLCLASFCVCLSSRGHLWAGPCFCVSLCVYVGPKFISGLSELNYHWPSGVWLLHVQPPVSPPIGLTAFSRQPWMGRLRAERRQTVKDGCHLSLMLNTATGPHYRGRRRRRMTGKLKKKKKEREKKRGFEQMKRLKQTDGQQQYFQAILWYTRYLNILKSTQKYHMSAQDDCW